MTRISSFAKMALASACLLAGSSTFAQKTKFNSGSAKPAFDKGSSTLGIFAGVGVNYGYYGNVSQLPAFGVLFDHGIIGNVGPGTIGIGGILAFQSAWYDRGGDRATWTNVIVGVRGTYHLTILKDKNNKFDPYAGAMLGVRFSSYDDPYYNGRANPYDYRSTYPIAGLFIGAKYNFTPNFGAFAELGYDISFFKAGLNFNF